MGLIDTNELTKAIRRLKTKFAAVAHKHSASDITSGTLDVSRGGTGISSNPSMLTNLSSTTADNVLKSSPRPGVTGALAIANGGTGATSAAGARTNLGVPSTTDLANIESSIAYVESTTAQANHAVGDYFMLGNVLMRATAAIAAGETINASKATPATLQGQIDTLRDSVAYSTAQAVIAASGFTVGGTATYNSIVTAVNIKFTATSNVTTMQFIVGTLQPAVRPKFFTSLVVSLTGRSPRFATVDVTTTGELSVTAQNPIDGVYMSNGETIWLRGLYMSC